MAGQSKMDLLAGAAGFGATLAILPLVLQKTFRTPQQKEGTTKHLEFGGPVGAFSTMLLLPGVIGFLYCGCNKSFVVRGFNLRALTDVSLPALSDLVSTKAALIFGGWMGFQVLLERLLPGATVEGTDLAPAGGSGKLKYRINGHLAFWTSMALAIPFRSQLGVLYDEYLALAGVSVLFSTGLSAYLYASSFTPGTLQAKGGNSGNAVYDFFIGRELNPRIMGGTFDLKVFCELRPGLIGWAMLNLGMAAKQFENTGSVSAPMLLVNALQGLYVWDALYQEKAILSTMDITTDGFGYMLAFGDLAWVPFTYGLQARYLVDHDPHSSTVYNAVMAGLGLFGYYAFRAANGQKDQFRRDPKHPSVAHLKVMDVTNLATGRPSSLLVSGWWGMARKINYTADWMMALAWSGTTGLPSLSGSNTIMTYFYPIYFAVLLIHRAWRDDGFCSEKYGAKWEEYKKRVPCVFFPYIV